MGLYGPSTPKPDKKVGEAAVMSQELGRDYLNYMKSRNVTTDRWAAQDRSRDLRVFRPMQDRIIAEARNYDSPAAQRAAAREAVGDVSGEMARADAGASRELAAMGVNPNARRFVGATRGRSIDKGLAIAGAANMARRRVRAEGTALRGQAVNMGAGYAVNPLSSFATGNSGAAAGFSGAIGATGQAGQLHSENYANRLRYANAAQESSTGLFSSLGTVAGMFMGSSEETKTGKRKPRSMLKAVKDMRVDEWEYKPDAPLGDGGGKRHVGTYAEDFKKATGTGDGKTISVVDAIGVTMGAVKELAEKVEGKGRRARGIKAAA